MLHGPGDLGLLALQPLGDLRRLVLGMEQHDAVDGLRERIESERIGLVHRHAPASGAIMMSPQRLFESWLPTRAHYGCACA